MVGPPDQAANIAAAAVTAAMKLSSLHRTRRPCYFFRRRRLAWDDNGVTTLAARRTYHTAYQPGPAAGEGVASGKYPRRDNKTAGLGARNGPTRAVTGGLSQRRRADAGARHGRQAGGTADRVLASAHDGE